VTRARLLLAAALLALAAGSTSLSSGAFTATSANPSSTFTASTTFPSVCTAGTVSTTADFDKGIRSAGSPAPGPDDTTLAVGTTTAGGNAVFRALVHFQMPSIPAGCSFKGATLLMTVSSPTTPRTVNVHETTSAWTEATAWPGPSFAATALDGVAAAAGQLSWNVTPAAASIYAGGPNNGLLVKDSAEAFTQSGNRFQTFVSSEGTVGSRPTLVVSYQ
jgi:hypothetical protein